MATIYGYNAGETYTVNGNTITAISNGSSENTKMYLINGKMFKVPTFYTIYDIVNEYCQPKQNNDYYTNAIESNNKRQKKLEKEVKELKATQSVLEGTIAENTAIINKTEAEFGEDVEKSCDNQLKLNEYHEAIHNRSDAKKAKLSASLREFSHYMSLFNLALDTGKLKIQQTVFGK